MDISYEIDHIIYVVLSKLCVKQSNIMVEAHIQSSNPHGGVCRNIVPNIFVAPLNMLAQHILRSNVMRLTAARPIDV